MQELHSVGRFVIVLSVLPVLAMFSAILRRFGRETERLCRRKQLLRQFSVYFVTAKFANVFPSPICALTLFRPQNMKENIKASVKTFFAN